MNKEIRVSLEVILGILGCLLAIFTLLFGDNIYQQITGRSVFQNPSSSNSEMPTKTQAPSVTAIPSDTSVPLEYIPVVGEYGVLKFGPVDGSIYNDGENRGYYDTDRLYKNFILEVKIRNPYSISVGRWSYQIDFRSLQGSGVYSLLLGENRSWFLDQYDLGIVQSEGQTITSLDLGESATNVITLLCQDELGLFYVNGVFVSQLDLSYQSNKGYISIGFPAFSDQQVPGYYLHFEDLKIWTFPE